jgi:hypothetical protein
MSETGIYGGSNFQNAAGGSHSERQGRSRSGGGAHKYTPATVGRTPQDDGEMALSIFNHIKEQYAMKIDELNELKRQVFMMSNVSNSDGGQYVLDH